MRGLYILVSCGLRMTAEVETIKVQSRCLAPDAAKFAVVEGIQAMSVGTSAGGFTDLT